MMAVLLEMGFRDQRLNQWLLMKHRHNLLHTVNELVAMADNTLLTGRSANQPGRYTTPDTQWEGGGSFCHWCQVMCFTYWQGQGRFSVPKRMEVVNVIRIPIFSIVLGIETILVVLKDLHGWVTGGFNYIGMLKNWDVRFILDIVVNWPKQCNIVCMYQKYCYPRCLATSNIWPVDCIRNRHCRLRK